MTTELLTRDESALLAAVPDYLLVSDLFKAVPQQDGSQRFIYLEASNESLDVQQEVVLAKALLESSDYFLRYGNLDIDHYTRIGAQMGIPDYEGYEIGQPVDVRVQGSSTFVKGVIYSGPGAERANRFWSSLTEQRPPQRWYPSVGGKVLAKSVVIDGATRAKRGVVERVRWNNVGFSKTPVNQEVPTVATVPFGALVKSCPGGACGWDVAKALDAGYGTDSAALAGGGALRLQSLHGAAMSYWDFRDAIAGVIREVGGRPAELVRVARERFGLAPDTAAAWVERVMRDLQRRGKR